MGLAVRCNRRAKNIINQMGNVSFPFVIPILYHKLCHFPCLIEKKATEIVPEGFLLRHILDSADISAVVQTKVIF